MAQVAVGFPNGREALRRTAQACHKKAANSRLRTSSAIEHKSGIAN
jgi:hypothetical protein